MHRTPPEQKAPRRLRRPAPHAVTCCAGSSNDPRAIFLCPQPLPGSSPPAIVSNKRAVLRVSVFLLTRPNRNPQAWVFIFAPIENAPRRPPGASPLDVPKMRHSSKHLSQKLWCDTPRGPRVCFSYSSRKHFRGPSQVPVPAEGPAPPPPGRPRLLSLPRSCRPPLPGDATQTSIRGFDLPPKLLLLDISSCCPAAHRGLVAQ